MADGADPTDRTAEPAEGAEKTVSAKSAVPSVAKPSPPPPPAPTPTGDAAIVHDETPGATFAILEDGVGVVTVPADELFTAARQVRGLGYRILSLLSGYDRGDHLGVLYAFVKPASSPAEFGEMRLRVILPKSADGKPVEPECPSLVDLVPAADWQEREMWDLFGIRFVGHPDLRRMFMPEGWTGHPGRKDDKEPEQYIAMRDGDDLVVKKPEEGAW